MLPVNWDLTRVLLSASAGAAAAVLTGLLALSNYEVITLNDPTKVVFVAAIAAVAVVSALARPLRIVVLGKRARRQAKIDRVCASLAWGLHKVDSEIPVPPLGVSAWVIVGRWRWKRMKRIGKARVLDMPGPTHIRWVPGKGVIGACWARNKPCTVDTGRIYQRYKTVTAARWASVRDDTRLGLTHDEFLTVGDKYGTVIAVPMHDPASERLIGCVTVDAPAHPEGLHARLDRNEIREEIAYAAASIANLLT